MFSSRCVLEKDATSFISNQIFTTQPTLITMCKCNTTGSSIPPHATPWQAHAGKLRMLEC